MGSGSSSDYVIVGAGSAGSALARRLVDAGRTVHVLEAGPADEAEAIHRPQGWPALLAGPQDWAVMTVPQEFANGRSLFWPRGKVLGGSSSLNGMIYMRGHRSDYDGWAAQGCTGWAWDDVLPLFLRSEDHLTGANAHHRTGGPLPVSPITSPHPAARAFVDAAVAAGHKRNEDFNGDDLRGVGFNEMTVRDGRRMSAWQSFVAPVLDNPALTVTTGALIDKVVVESGRAVGVEYVAGGERRVARADAEVVLSAGTIGSPAILLRSGIGPAAHLREVGVEVVAEVAGVGENLHDHPLISVVYESPGPLPEGRANLLEAQFYADSAGWTGAAPDLQPLFLHLVYPAEGYEMPEHGYTIAAGIVAPKSRGTLRLASADPAEPALVDPRILADPYDLEALCDAIEMSREVGRQRAFDPWRKREVAPGPEATTREHVREFARRSVGTYHHQVGTCRMGVDELAVVDPELRVRGVAGLRVADASIMPKVPSCNTNAPAIMVGEKAAELITG
ncbi:GMC family oxidoreductase [Amycolatopsis sp. 195334CR]|uniref:GMC family oxidoreductase n=1 Tax=Amycolatopsis sp. 195334CR TaxID=2814588 RepID=UPI001A90C0B3|nr:GMC family oxidoreductase N-terminal domain-containing protein [Amycolatopsis sp. 195334CR]MBN6040994.1 GMC family oxidoreductase N-terminal domain-containing protein [Amycolatopsis sp. 195334CR]